MGRPPTDADGATGVGLASQFRGLFLGPGDLPGEMRCIRDARDADASPPFDDGAAGWQKAGWMTWFAPPDAALYRVDDVRWLFGSEGGAEDWYRHEVDHAGAAGRPAPVADAVGFRTAAFELAGGGCLHLLVSGVMVCRLQAVPGEDAVLDGRFVQGLAVAVASRTAFFLAGWRPEPVKAWWAR